MERIGEYQDLISGAEVAFGCLGTTRSEAGSAVACIQFDLMDLGAI